MTGAKTLPPRVILVVEDDILIRDTIADDFRKIGWTVIEAGSFDEALELATSSAPIDILFTDIDLRSEQNGWDVADAFRAARPAAGVIYASGVARSKERILDHAVFLAKPYMPEEVFQACRAVM
jgi:CheY-like chemotaxis protein